MGIPADRTACDFVHCRNYCIEGYCLRSRKAASLCAYQQLRTAYEQGMTRKDRLMSDLIGLVKRSEQNRQTVAKAIRRELRKRNNANLADMSYRLCGVEVTNDGV